MPRLPAVLLLLDASLYLSSLALAQSPAAILGNGDFKLSDGDWPWWRGPQRNGVVDVADATPLLKWSSTENVLWQAKVPGRGHSSPTVVGRRLFLTTADDEAQYVLCFDASNGDLLWTEEIHRGGFPPKSNERSSHASSTVACDGERVYANFMQDGAVFTTALSCDGERVWQTRISDYVVHQGYGSSPTIYGNIVIVAADNKSGGMLAALDRRNGDFVWKQPRPKLPNYPSPTILSAAGREQLLMTGCELVSGFDPASGEKLWEFSGATTECVTTTVTNGDLIFSSGGYPDNHVAAYRADGTGEQVWRNTTRVYVPSMLVHGDHLYAVADGGIAICWDSRTGEEKWKHRLGGTFNASPVLVGDRIYASSESGTTFLYEASPEAFRLVAENQLGDDVYATPTFSRGRIFARVAVREGEKRQEVLYCLGRSP